MKKPDQGRAPPPGAALLNSALQHLQSGRLAEAERALQQVLNRSPDEPDAVHLLGLVALQQRKLAEAERLLTKATQLDRHQPAAWNNLGVALREQNKLTEAVAAYRKALSVAPDFTDALSNLGGALNRLQRHEEAIPALRRALSQNPQHAEALNNLGSALFQKGTLGEAETHLRRALAVAPRMTEAWNNLGSILADQGKDEDAIAAYRKAVDSNPGHAEAYCNLGVALRSVSRVDESMAALRRAVALRPGYEQAETYLYLLFQDLCDWDGAAAAAPRLDTVTRAALADARRPSEMPFLSVSRCDDPAVNFAIAKAWGEDLAQRHRPLFSHPQRPAKGRDDPIVLGYLSSDLRDHAVGHLMLGQFRYHDRSRFRVYLYNKARDDGSAYRQQFAADSDKHINVDGMDASDTARMMHEDGVDILIELNGWTKDHGLAICAHRPAPLQVTHVGFPGTTGAPFIDYCVVDPIVAPPEHAPFFSEKLVHLPHSYQPNNNAQKISDREMTRAECGLPEDGIVFASFNQSYKLERVMFAVWMSLLNAVPGSVLWLLSFGEIAETNLRQEAAKHGIDPHRLIFAPKMPKPEHLRRIQLADLCLDTRIYTGHTTTSDVLWTGVPVIALRGRHFASLVSASGLTNMGMSELVTDSLEGYETLALRLARDAGARNDLRARIAANRPVSPLFDTPRFVRNLERAYLRMWDTYCAGEPPQPIAITDSGADPG